MHYDCHDTKTIAQENLRIAILLYSRKNNISPTECDQGQYVCCKSTNAD